jgi:hypothetical protein
VNRGSLRSGDPGGDRLKATVKEQVLKLEDAGRVEHCFLADAPTGDVLLGGERSRHQLIDQPVHVDLAAAGRAVPHRSQAASGKVDDSEVGRAGLSRQFLSVGGPSLSLWSQGSSITVALPYRHCGRTSVP